MQMHKKSVAMIGLAALAGAVVAADDGTFTIPLGTGSWGSSSDGTSRFGSYGTWMQEAMSGLGGMLTDAEDGEVGFMTGMPRYAFSSEEMWAGYDELKAEHCTEPVWIEPGKVGAAFTGPATVMAVKTGICALVWDETTKSMSLACEKPKIVTEKTSATYAGKAISPFQYQSKNCSVEKQFGKALTEVLYTFDKDTKFDPAKMTAEVTAKLQAIMDAEMSQYSAGSMLGDFGRTFQGGLMENTHRVSLKGPEPTPEPVTTTIVPGTVQP